MANDEQLNILKQGVEVWNSWRAAHPEEAIDLSEANLNSAELPKINLQDANLFKAELFRCILHDAVLCEANLSQANLSRAKLRYANLTGADLFGANLHKAVLEKANLNDCDLREADLSLAPLLQATLREADLRNTNLHEAFLQQADLYKADLRNANLGQTNLGEAVLHKALLYRANLRGAHLYRCKLSQADLREVDLIGAELREADLRDTDLRGVRFLFSTLNHADLTGANLYGSSRNDWKIDGVRCEYIYWDDRPNFEEEEREQAQQWEAVHRFPKDRDFRPGEFEELYKSLPTIEYYFEHGFTPIDAVLMDKVVQAINERHPEFELKLSTLDSRGQPHAVFTVVQQEQTDAALKQIRQDYEARIQQLQGKEAALLQVIDMLSSRPQSIELVLGDKRMITTGRDYHEQTVGDTIVSDSSGK